MAKIRIQNPASWTYSTWTDEMENGNRENESDGGEREREREREKESERDLL